VLKVTKHEKSIDIQKNTVKILPYALKEPKNWR